jgi:hypothetical protein
VAICATWLQPCAKIDIKSLVKLYYLLGLENRYGSNVIVGSNPRVDDGGNNGGRETASHPSSENAHWPRSISTVEAVALGTDRDWRASASPTPATTPDF